MTQEERTAAYAAYDRLHRACPKCGSTAMETTCMGYVMMDLQTHLDRNKTTCGNCGWVGIVHARVPAVQDPMTELDMLEELLSITEQYVSGMLPADRVRWQAISARTADLREGDEV